jgi:hypothetical protein
MISFRLTIYGINMNKLSELVVVKHMLNNSGKTGVIQGIPEYITLIEYK